MFSVIEDDKIIKTAVELLNTNINDEVDYNKEIQKEKPTFNLIVTDAEYFTASKDDKKVIENQEYEIMNTTSNKIFTYSFGLSNGNIEQKFKGHDCLNCHQNIEDIKNKYVLSWFIVNKNMDYCIFCEDCITARSKRKIDEL
jgi:hypothetical protein